MRREGLRWWVWARVQNVLVSHMQAYQTHEVLGAALSPAFYLVARDVAD